MFINKVTTKIKYINCCLTQINVRYFCDTLNDFEERKTRKVLLQKYLGLSYPQSAAYIRKHEFLQTIDSNKLDETLYSLKKLDINKEDILETPLILTFHYNTIEHNAMYLQEAGFKDVSASVLLRFRSIVKKPVGLLKAHGVISEDVNVPNKLYSYLTPKPLQFPLLDTFNEEHSIFHMHAEIFKHYLVWGLDTSEDEINRIFKTYHNFKYRSFKLMSTMIKILTKELNFSKQKLLQQSYLFQVNPQYPIQLLNLFPNIAGTDIKYILYRYPKIIAAPPDSIQTILQHLQRFNVSDEALKNCFDIFTLCPDTVLHRLNEAEQIPEFKALKNNKRYIRLLFNYNKAKLRLDHLQNNQVKSASMNILIASDNLFEKFAIEGYETNRGTDVINYLSDIFGIPNLELRKLLTHNPHWCQVPLINIQDTLKYLQKLRFTFEEIGKLPVILLYSRRIINDAISELDNHPELFRLILNNKEKLNLLLYFIERKYHFSGDGVWEDKTVNTEISEDLPEHQYESVEEIKNRTIC